MLPLALLLLGRGYRVSGSDRARDQGRSPEKFQWLEAQGVTLYPQDGSGLQADVDALVISKAVEEGVPDVVAARALNIPIRMRADILLEHFNQAKNAIAVAGTSGKTTTTGMIGYILKEAALDPTIMNGGIFRNYIGENPYSTAFVGQGEAFVAEIDESDGAEVVAKYKPAVGLLHNITHDHQSMEELRGMFALFLKSCRSCVVNAEDAEVMALVNELSLDAVTYGTPEADFYALDYTPAPAGSSCVIISKEEGRVPLTLQLPGRHNVSNALAAIATVKTAIPSMALVDICRLLSGFEGIRRRMEIVGTKNGVTVIDDFAHNPDKIAASLQTLKEFDGRLLIFFQPHGYGFIKLLGDELAEAFASHLGGDDRLFMVEPLYMGGTVDRSIGVDKLVEKIRVDGQVHAELLSDRKGFENKVLSLSRPGDRVVVMGARDDTLSTFAQSLFQIIP